MSFDAGALIFKIQTAGYQTFAQQMEAADRAVERVGKTGADAAPKVEKTGTATEQLGKKAKDAKAPLDEDMPVLQGKFSVSWNGGNAGYADKGIVTFALASDGVVPRITSPLAGSGVPILESASPAGLAPGDLIKVRGYKLGSAVSATIKAVAVVKLRVIDENTVTLLIPATVSGSSPIIITNAVGASTALPYTAA